MKNNGLKELALVGLVSLVVFFGLGFIAPAEADPPERPERVVIKFRPGVTADRQEQIMAERGHATDKYIHQLKMRIIKVPKGKTAEDVIKRYQKHPLIEYAEKEVFMEPQATPNDIWYPNWQLDLQQLGAEAAWDITTGSLDIPIGVIDSGIDIDHYEFVERIARGEIYGYDFADDDPDFDDPFGHGTLCGGIIGAETNNELGIAGACWHNPLAVMRTAYGMDAIEAIVWAADNGVRVISMSFGCYTNMSSLETACEYAFDRGVVLVNSAGNNGTNMPLYPGAYPTVLAVTGVDYNGYPVGFNWGDWVDLSGPAGCFTTTLTDYDADGIDPMGGTSASAPFVAAAAGLVLSANPELSNVQVMDILRQTATDLTTAISMAEHLDANKNLIADVTTQMSELDGVWSQTISDGEYLRVEFDRANVSLRAGDDITIYPRVVSGSPSIDVYLPDDPEIVASFDNLNQNAYNEVLLSALWQGNPDNIIESEVFDLQVVNGAVELDHIVSNPGYDLTTGWGRVNYHQAVLLAQETSPEEDIIPPTAAIVSPEAGSILSGVATVLVEASDNIGVSLVELYLDGGLVSADEVAPHEWFLDTTEYSDEEHTLSAVAYDAAGNTGESEPVVITIDNIPAENTPPVVNAGEDQQITLPAIAYLEGIAYDDGLPNPPGALTINWSKLTGPGTVTFSDASALDATASFSEAGSYTLELTASDSQYTSTDTLSITVNPEPIENTPPVVDAGNNQEITLPAIAYLDGTVTDDGLPNPPGEITVEWSKLSGKGRLTITNANAVDTTVSFKRPGTYVFKLTASDSQLSASDTVTIIVNPKPKGKKPH